MPQPIPFSSDIIRDERFADANEIAMYHPEQLTEEQMQMLNQFPEAVAVLPVKNREIPQALGVEAISSVVEEDRDA